MFYQYYKSPLFSTIAHDKHLQIAFHCSRIITAVLVFSPSLSLSFHRHLQQQLLEPAIISWPVRTSG
jgi:hypothetical protein